MPPKASIFRLDPDAQFALAQLSKLTGRPMNKLVNESVKGYLLNTSEAEREIAGSLASLRAYRERDRQVTEPPATYFRASDLNSEVLAAARNFIRRVSAQHAVKAALLFGSRARGDHRPDSDVDIAVLLHGRRGQLMDTSIAMADIAFDVLLETKVYIQPLPIWEDEWEHPERHSNPRLLENIQREGLPV